jgi:hypothetical protein
MAAVASGPGYVIDHVIPPLAPAPMTPVKDAAADRGTEAKERWEREAV